NPVINAPLRFIFRIVSGVGLQNADPPCLTQTELVIEIVFHSRVAPGVVLEHEPHLYRFGIGPGTVCSYRIALCSSVAGLGIVKLAFRPPIHRHCVCTKILGVVLETESRHCVPVLAFGVETGPHGTHRSAFGFVLEIGDHPGQIVLAFGPGTAYCTHRSAFGSVPEIGLHPGQIVLAFGPGTAYHISPSVVELEIVNLASRPPIHRHCVCTKILGVVLETGSRHCVPVLAFGVETGPHRNQIAPGFGVETGNLHNLRVELAPGIGVGILRRRHVRLVLGFGLAFHRRHRVAFVPGVGNQRNACLPGIEPETVSGHRMPLASDLGNMDKLIHGYPRCVELVPGVVFVHRYLVLVPGVVPVHRYHVLV
uniref:Uncharacterized protein n=1 Tax=Ciona intestinalis TaxID=7719 RepID=F6QKI0_CIOIN